MINKMISPRIVIVGGGAGGMELAALLGRKFGKAAKASITLVDVSPIHIWKPLLHEVAAGSLYTNENEIAYLTYAATHHFHFVLGAFEGLNRSKKEIYLAPFYSHEKEILSQRTLAYDILIIAVGSVVNDFGIPGVKEHCLFLDNLHQASYYHDHGSLVTLSHYQVVGNLMGKITESLKVEGKLARLFYLSLYKQHQISLYGWWRVFLLTLSNLLSRRVKPRLKLH